MSTLVIAEHDNGSLSIQIGPMTKAMCAKGSHSDQFVQNLGFVSNFFWQNGYLYLDMMADGGTARDCREQQTAIL